MLENLKALLRWQFRHWVGALLKGATQRDDIGTSGNPSFSLIQALGGSSTSTGIRVGPGNALNCLPVYKCVRLLSETWANLPLGVFERLPDGSKRPAEDHPGYPLLHDAPNALQTSFEWREMGMGHYCLRGNHYSRIIRDGYGRLEQLVPLHPDRVGIYQSELGELYYFITPRVSKAYTLSADNVLHVRGLSSDGIEGYSPISLMREPIALALGGEEFSARLLRNGARLSGFLTTPEAMDEEDATRLLARFKETNAGLSNAGGVALFDAGMSWQQMGMSATDAQILESRKFQAADIYGAYGIPPHMVGDTERQTSWGTGIEQQTIGFMVFTMMGHVRRHEQRYNLQLFTPEERRRYFVEANLNNLVRGDIKSRYAAYAVARQWGWLSVNDIRRLENMNPLGPEGDVYLQPLNMVAAGEADERTLLPDGERTDAVSDAVYDEVHGGRAFHMTPVGAPIPYRAVRIPTPGLPPEQLRTYFERFRA